jgi:hypothetical protein
LAELHTDHIIQGARLVRAFQFSHRIVPWDAGGRDARRPAQDTD